MIMRERIAFSIGIFVILTGIALVVSGVAQAQTGPDWEIPMAAATNWFLFGVFSIFLYLLAIICYVRGNRFVLLGPTSRKAFATLLAIGVLATVVSYVLEPGQWRVRHPALSVAIQRSAIPIWLSCLFAWILLTRSTWRKQLRTHSAP